MDHDTKESIKMVLSMDKDIMYGLTVHLIKDNGFLMLLKDM
jgi:hypothetical protein